MECYLLLMALNRDQEEAARLLEKTRYELRVRGNVGPEQRLVEETELGDILENERGKLGAREKRMYNYLSNRAMHLHTISSANVPGRYRSVVERDCLQSGAFLGSRYWPSSFEPMRKRWVGMRLGCQLTR